jgi:hypothetical protein
MIIMMEELVLCLEVLNGSGVFLGLWDNPEESKLVFGNSKHF